MALLFVKPLVGLPGDVGQAVQTVIGSAVGEPSGHMSIKFVIVLIGLVLIGGALIGRALENQYLDKQDEIAGGFDSTDGTGGENLVIPGE